MSHRPSQVPALDGVRALAIACVLGTHLWTYPARTPILNRIAAAGWLGVDLFFVLSGFLITRGLIASRERPDYYRHFYSRRIRRIVPVYYLVLAVALLALPVVSHADGLQAARHDWLWYVTYLPNVRLAMVGWQVFILDVTWSLGVEEQFYLVWPWVVGKLTDTGLLRFALACVILTPVLRAVCLETGLVSARWLDLVTPFRADSLAMGAVLAVIEARLPRFSARYAALLTVLAITVLACVVTGQFGRESTLVTIGGHTVLALMAALLIVASLDASCAVARILAWRPARAIGRISYGVYLYHPLTLAVTGTLLARLGLTINALTGHPIMDGVAQLVVVSVIASGVAWLSFTYIETPFLTAAPRAPSAVPRPVVAQME